MREDLRTSGLTEVAAKAYLSRKDIEELFLPDTVEQIGNWAFAHMKNLKKLVVPRRAIQLGKEVFKGCDKLDRVVIEPYRMNDAEDYDAENGSSEAKRAEDVAYLLAAALRYLGTQELFVPKQVGSDEWLAQFDEKLLEFLDGGDEVGFNPMWFGGEEDYNDNDTNVEIYRKKRQQEKLSVVMLRLFHDTGLSEEARGLCQEFLRNTLLEGDVSEFWHFLAETYGVQSRLIGVLTDAGCICLQNQKFVLRVFSDIGPEGKASLVAWYAKQTVQDGFFAGLDL